MELQDLNTIYNKEELSLIKDHPQINQILSLLNNKYNEDVFIQLQTMKQLEKIKDIPDIFLEYPTYQSKEWHNLLIQYQTIKNIQKEDTIFIDLETTGLNNKEEEILQLAIIDGNNHIKFNEYIKPTYKTNWDDTIEIHGITYDMVEDKKHIDEYINDIQTIIDECKQIVIYNAPFDQGFLEESSIDFKDKIVTCAMRMYTPIKGIWNEKHNNYRWHKLMNCAKHYNYEFIAHNALNDIMATRHIYYCMLEDIEEILKNI